MSQRHSNPLTFLQCLTLTLCVGLTVVSIVILIASHQGDLQRQHDPATVTTVSAFPLSPVPAFAQVSPQPWQRSRNHENPWSTLLRGAAALLGIGLVWQVLRQRRAIAKAVRFRLPSSWSTHRERPHHDALPPEERSPLVPCTGDLAHWLFDHGSTVVAVCLSDGCILLGNTALNQLFKSEDETIHGLNVFDLCFLAADRELARATIAQLPARTWQALGSQLIDRRGELRWFDWQVRSITPYTDDQILSRIWDNVKHHADLSLDHRARFPETVYLYLGIENTDRQQERDLINLQYQLMERTVTVQTYSSTILAVLDCFCQCLPWSYVEAWVLDHPEETDDDPVFSTELNVSKILYSCRPEQQDGPIAKYCRTPLTDRRSNFAIAPPILNALQIGQPYYFDSLDHLPNDAFSHRDLALASGLNTCFILPLGSKNARIICLLFAPRDSVGIVHGKALMERLVPHINLLLTSKYQDSHANPFDLDFNQRPFENTVEGLFRLSPDGYYVHANFALARMFGYETSEDLIQTHIKIYDQFVTESRCTKFERHLSHGNPIDNFVAELYRRDGTTIWIEAVARVISDEVGQNIGYEGSMINITDRQRTEDKLRYGATHDDLTGLWNRAWFVEQLQRILKRARRYDRYTFAVLFVDLDNFKLINDTLGHMVGDRLLVALAQRLNGALQQGQSLARLGGDEFTLCIDRITDESEAIAIAQTLCHQLQKPFQIGSHELIACASIGIVIGSRQYETPEMVLKDADIAMYNAKARGKIGTVDESRYVLFDTEMGRASQRRLRLEDDLRRAIEYDELSLHYQPIIDLASMETVGFEVLLRWQHSKYGAISPAEFIPIAEESGMIVKLGEWVLFQACQQLQSWKQDGLEVGKLSLSVNVSSRQLSSGLIAQIDRALRTYDIQPGELKVEITETVVMSDLNQAKLVLKQIKERQIPILLDDFGTGYCSLNYLYELPIDTLKIDRSFVRTIDERPDRRQVLDTIFQLADSLGLKVIAEGVENSEQLAYLEQQNRCYGQGYMFSKPVPAPIARTLLGQVWSKLAV
ncbi:MAG: EAL domain-containing protein [Oscillatoriales cyanobacterium]|nr:MAG: EAL domain-containing protein [Oscillatoriales cyanobacterium]